MKRLDYDVVVVGAGSAGICAAIMAGRENKNVLLVEKTGVLGGISTTILDTMNGFYLPGKDNLKVVEGIGNEIIEHLGKDCFNRANTYGSGTVITYNPETLKDVYLDLLLKANVKILFHAIANEVSIEDNTINHIVLNTKKDKYQVYAKVFIDCSGDADIAYHAGYSYDGVNSNTHVQSLTSTFRVSNIDEDKAKTFTKQDMWKWMKEANASGKYVLPRDEGSFHKTTLKGCVATNMVRVILKDPTDPFELSNAEIEGRKQANEYFRFMKDYLPGYENSELQSISTQIGVRETRRIIGEYILKSEDVINGVKFDDGIALCGSPVEDHNQTSDTKWVYLKENDAYLIPFRSLIPLNSKNLLVAGRCFSSSHTAHASARSIAQCMSMGQAAGLGASILIDDNCVSTNINNETLKQKLQSYNVKLEVN